MLKKPLFIDNLQYSNWSLEIFEQMREANLTAVHVTICYHENFRQTIENIISWNKFIELHPDLLILARNADDVRTGDLHLSNEHRGGNTIDGSWGHYQIQEGEDDLFIMNKRSGKKFRFVLEQV